MIRSLLTVNNDDDSNDRKFLVLVLFSLEKGVKISVKDSEIMSIEKSCNRKFLFPNARSIF